MKNVIPGINLAGKEQEKVLISKTPAIILAAAVATRTEITNPVNEVDTCKQTFHVHTNKNVHMYVRLYLHGCLYVSIYVNVS